MFINILFFSKGSVLHLARHTGAPLKDYISQCPLQLETGHVINIWLVGCEWKMGKHLFLPHLTGRQRFGWVPKKEDKQ